MKGGREQTLLDMVLESTGQAERAWELAAANGRGVLGSVEGAELTEGIRRFTVGLGKKALLANPCGALADALLLAESTASDPTRFVENLSYLQDVTVLGAWVGMAAFMLQIYLDFSAYSDMAIGMGKMLGLHYPENFNYPYTARSVTDFWRRWHMSLSTFSVTMSISRWAATAAPWPEICSTPSSYGR